MNRESNGIAVQRENAPGHLMNFDPSTDVVVRTPAVPMSAPELLEASENGFAIFDRGVAFAAMTAQFDTLAVCGTHGKTTTSCFLAGILRNLVPEKTSWAIGGLSPLLGAVTIWWLLGISMVVLGVAQMVRAFRANSQG